MGLPNKKYIRRTLWVGITAVILIFAVRYYSMPGKYDGLAQCLKDNKVTFYGAFWCPHCQNQKALFGKSARLLPYVECSTVDGRGQTDVCKEKNIQSYPTWVFPDGSQETGEVALGKLAEKSGCPFAPK